MELEPEGLGGSAATTVEAVEVERGGWRRLPMFC